MTTQLDGLENCPLHKRTPFGIRNVSQTQFSIARYSGGCTFNGDNFIYIPLTDELIRADVLKWKKKAQKNVHVPNAFLSEPMTNATHKVGPSDPCDT